MKWALLLSFSLFGCEGSVTSLATNPETSNSNNVTDMNVGDANSDQPTEPSDEFLAVYELMLGWCAGPDCHGPISTAHITRNRDRWSTVIGPAPVEVYEALMAGGPTDDGPPLISPGDAAASNIIQRMSMPRSDNINGREMPPGTGSPQENVETVTRWINNGAQFSETE